MVSMCCHAQYSSFPGPDGAGGSRYSRPDRQQNNDTRRRATSQPPTGPSRRAKVGLMTGPAIALRKGPLSPARGFSPLKISQKGVPDGHQFPTGDFRVTYTSGSPSFTCSEAKMKAKIGLCILVIAALVAGCGSGQRKVNKSEAAVNQERLSLIEDYKKCVKKAGKDEAKKEACESHRKAAEALGH